MNRLSNGKVGLLLTAPVSNPGSDPYRCHCLARVHFARARVGFAWLRCLQRRGVDLTWRSPLPLGGSPFIPPLPLPLPLQRTPRKTVNNRATHPSFAMHLSPKAHAAAAALFFHPCHHHHHPIPNPASIALFCLVSGFQTSFPYSLPSGKISELPLSFFLSLVFQGGDGGISFPHF